MERKRNTIHCQQHTARIKINAIEIKPNQLITGGTKAFGFQNKKRSQ